MLTQDKSPITFPATLDSVDLIAIEHRARQMRAEAIADMMRAAKLWVVARLQRAPLGRTA